jgi:homoserine O-acetyltransferase/O-succinyltransferase
MKLDCEIFELGNVRLQRGATLRNGKLAYKTFGKMNAAKDNVIVYPTWYSGQHYDNEWLVGPDMALDPEKYFIIIPNMLGNGLSSSPSNMPAPYNASRFPRVTACDNVRIQHRLVTQKFGVKKLALVTGWSMGALQTFHWGALYPEMVERIAPFCGSAKCSRHNFVFLEGVKAALTADSVFNGGWYKDQPVRGPRLCRLGLLAGLLSPATRHRAARLFLARRFPRRLLGRLLSAEGCQQSPRHAVDLAVRGH